MGVEGERSQGGVWNRRSQMLVQRPARMRPQGKVDGGRAMVEIWQTTPRG